MILQTTQTYYFKRLFSYPKHFFKFFRISNALQQQRFFHKLKASAKIFKRTSLANIISYPTKPFSSSTLFIKVIKIIHKHDRLLRCATFFGKFSRISNALKQQRFSHKLKASAKLFKRTSLANIISYLIKPFSSSTLFINFIKVIKIIHKHDRLLRCATLFGKFFRISNALKQQRFCHKLKASAKIFKRTSLANIISYPIKLFSSSTLFIKVIEIIHKHDRLLRCAALFGKFFRISNALLNNNGFLINQRRQQRFLNEHHLLIGPTILSAEK